MKYVLAPFVGWVAAGSLKFLLNTLASGKLAFHQVGLGRMPSTHTTVVCTTAALVGFGEGVATPVFAIALTLALVVIIDALDLRRRLESHAVAINRLGLERPEWNELRERLGHRPTEVLAGIILGVALGWVLASFDSL